MGVFLGFESGVMSLTLIHSWWVLRHFIRAGEVETVPQLGKGPGLSTLAGEVICILIWLSLQIF